MHCAPGYRCHVCCRKFKKFIIFEGHLTFHRECRQHFGSYMQCYMCLKRFNHLAALKYHLRCHKNVRQPNDVCGTNLHPIDDSTMHHSTAIATDSNQIDGNVNGGAPNGSCHRSKIHHRYCRSNQQLERHSSITNMVRHATNIHKFGKVECKICKIRFTKLTLERHQRMIHPSNDKVIVDSREPQPSTATIEKKKTNAEQNTPSGSLKRPNLQRKHNAEHQCPICKAFFTHNHNMTRHLKVHTFGKLTCNICGVKFTNISLIQHKALFHPPVVEDLHREPLSGKMEKSLLKRLRFQSNNIPAVKRKYPKVESSTHRCHICNAKFTFASSLIRHQHMHKSGKLTCKICNVRLNNLKVHNKRVHPELLDPGLPTQLYRNRKFVCNVCQLNCKSKARLERHKMVHIVGRFECDICRIPFTKLALSCHMGRVHPDLTIREPDDSISSHKIYNCSECSESFTSNRQLQLHMKWHCDKNSECYVCGEQPFPTFNDFSSHLNKHKIYERWVDPANIHLSNWSHDESQEILANQPLVLVEKLDASRIDLRSLSDFIQRSGGGNDTVDDWKNDWRSAAEETEPKPVNQTGMDDYAEDKGRQNETASIDCRDCAEAVEQNENVFVPISIESQGPSPTHHSPHTDDGRSEPLPISIQPIDYMGNNDEDNITGDVIDDVIYISSDDCDDDEVISQVFYCALCNELCYSLNDLGFHNKMCLLSEK